MLFQWRTIYFLKKKADDNFPFIFSMEVARGNILNVACRREDNLHHSLLCAMRVEYFRLLTNGSAVSKMEVVFARSCVSSGILSLKFNASFCFHVTQPWDNRNERELKKFSQFAKGGSCRTKR